MKRGYTLVELIAVMGCLSVIFGIAMMLFFNAFDFQLRYEEQSLQVRSTDRLVEQFQDDTRSFGKPVCMPTENVLLRWTAGDRTIEYVLTPGAFPEKKNVVRYVKQGETTVQTETFALPDDSHVAFVQGQGEFADFLAMSLWTDVPNQPQVRLDALDPFRRTVPESLEKRLDPRFAGNWRTVLVQE